MRRDARRLGGPGAATVDGIEIASAQTNMVFATVTEDKIAGLSEHLRSNEILITNPIAGSLRLVTHLDVDANAIRTAIAAFAEYFA